MELKLNIYKKENGKRIVDKTYNVDTYDIMFGTAEDLIQSLNLDGLNTEDNMELIKVASKVVINSFDTIKPLLKDVFEGLTDDELRNTKVSEIISVLVGIVKSTMAQIGMGNKGKN